MSKDKDGLQKGVDKIIKGHGGKPIGNTGKKYDMTEEVKKEGDKGKGGKSK
jgi:hypothetical protein